MYCTLAHFHRYNELVGLSQYKSNIHGYRRAILTFKKDIKTKNTNGYQGPASLPYTKLLDSDRFWPECTSQ